MHDSNTRLFLDDGELLVRERLFRMTQPLRKESAEPVLAANGEEEGSALAYSTVIHDPAARQFKLWYLSHQDSRVRLAVSEDARRWTRRGFAMPGSGWRFDNLGLTVAGKRLDPWFEGARWVGYGYSQGKGLHALKCMDGEHLDLRTPGIIPGAGDRSSLYYDDVRDEYWLISRRGSLGLPGVTAETFARPRIANLWTSANLIDWDDRGVILRYDEEDDPDVEIYGMQPFRCGHGFIALVEIYHKNIERLDTQLAYSRDGLDWRRVQGRTAVLPRGGEGAWDSHWVVPTLNPPIPWGDRVLIPYVGAATKHGSGGRHRRGIGLASIRLDGWVSLEAGRTEGLLVTHALSAEKPMALEINADVYGGYLAVEVISAVPGREHQPVPGYEAAKSRVEKLDAVRHRIAWGERTVVAPVEGGKCHLRISVYQGSLFSYRWSHAEK